MTRFLACFPVSKFQKRRRLVNPTSHQLSYSSINSSQQRDESDSAAVQSNGCRKQQHLENPINLVSGSEECHYKSKKKVKFDLKVSTFEEEVKADLNVSAIKEESSPNKEEEASSVSFALTPLNPQSDEEEKSAVEEEEESSESLFSLSVDSRARVSVAESDDNKEVNSPIPSCKLDESVLDSVFSSDEQLGQLKASTKFNHQDQENISPPPAGGLENDSKESLTGKNLAVQETVVDASLSSWLVESGETAVSNSSTDQSVVNMPSGGDAKPPIVVSRNDRPVLGELRMEKKPTGQSATRSSSRPCESEKPVAGTIGSYWSHTGQALGSDSSISFGTPRTRSINKEVERAKWRELWKELSAQI